MKPHRVGLPACLLIQCELAVFSIRPVYANSDQSIGRFKLDWSQVRISFINVDSSVEVVMLVISIHNDDNTPIKLEACLILTRLWETYTSVKFKLELFWGNVIIEGGVSLELFRDTKQLDRSFFLNKVPRRYMFNYFFIVNIFI